MHKAQQVAQNSAQHKAQKQAWLKRLCAYKSKLLQAASVGEWFQVRQIDRSLRDFVSALNANGAKQDAEVKAAITELTSCYDKVIQLAYRQQDQLQQKLYSLQKNSEGVKAYSENLMETV